MLKKESDPDLPDIAPVDRSHRQHGGQDPLDPPPQNLAARVVAKLEVGDIKGAIHLASSEDIFTGPTPVTLSALQEKHLPQKLPLDL